MALAQHVIQVWAAMPAGGMHPVASSNTVAQHVGCYQLQARKPIPIMLTAMANCAAACTGLLANQLRR